MPELSTIIWCIGFALMMVSFTFLFGRSEERTQPRISVDPWWPDSSHDHRS